MREKRPEVEAGETEGGRSPTGVPPAARSASPGVLEVVPDPEVLEKPARRRFSAEYKARVLAQVDACIEPGQQGALLRREGLYSSHLAKWRKQRDEGALAGLTPKGRGRNPKRTPLKRENERLLRENTRLREELRKAALIIEVQKKVSQILGVPQETSERDESA
jgi:transposase